MIRFKQFLIEELHVLMEVPSIEDQIDTGEEAIRDVKRGAKNLVIRPPNSKVTSHPTFSFEPLKVNNFGKFSAPINFLGALKDAAKGFDHVNLPGGIGKAGGRVRINTSLIDPKTQTISSLGSNIVGHEAGGHAYQHTAQARDVVAGKNVDPDSYDKKLKTKKETLQKRYIERKASPSDLSTAEFAQYRFEPQEVNARSVEGAIATKELISSVVDGDTTQFKSRYKRNHESRTRLMNYGMSIAQTDADVELPRTATRHERSQLKRQKIMATKDARAAVSRGIQKAMSGIDFLTTPEWVADRATKDRNAEIQRRVQAMRDKASGTKAAPSPEVNVGKIASTVLDPVSAAADAVTVQASKSAPKFATKSLPGSRIPVMNMAAGLGAGVVGGLAGEFAVKPAAEKLGAFKPVEAGGAFHRTLSKAPAWVAKGADVALGAAQVALDPISAAVGVMGIGQEAKAKREMDAALKAGSPSKVRVTGPKI